MKNIITFLSGLTRPTPKTSVIARCFQPGVERLEDRIAPANVVQTSLVGGTLTITTVDQLGEAEIVAGDNQQLFKIVGTGPGNVSVNQTGPTTIDGLATKAFTGVTHIVINLKSGSDDVTCETLDLSGDLTYHGGDGGGLFRVDALGGATKLRNLTVVNLEGVDNVAIVGASTTISGSVSIKNGPGGSNNNIGFFLGDDVTIQGALTVTNGDGNDNVNFSGDDFQVGGAVTIRNGNGDSSVQFNCDNSLVFTKALTIVNGSGNDTFAVNSFNQTSSFAGITIQNGLGNSTTRFASATSDTVTGNLLVTNGSGNDSFIVDGPSFAVTGFVKISNGIGNSTTDISPTTSNTVGGAFTLTTAAGADTTTISGATVTYGSVALKHGVGGSTTTIAAAVSAAIQGTLRITNADGMDTQTIGSGAGDFSGLHSVFISNGLGDSNTLFNPALLTITGSVSVTNLDGFDEFDIGTGTLSNFSVTGAVSVKNGLGGSVLALAPTVAGTITGALTFVGSSGNNTLDLIRTTITGASNINLGNGFDFVQIDNSTLGAVVIKTGLGNDLVQIETSPNDGIGSSMGGAVSIDLGGGDDFLAIGLDANDFVTTSKSLTLKGGPHLDRFEQSTAPNSFALAPKLSGFEVQLP